MKRNDEKIIVYKKELKEWLEIDENKEPRTVGNAFLAEEYEDAKNAVSGVVGAYCEFQDIVSGNEKIQCPKVSFREKLKLWEKWAKED